MSIEDLRNSNVDGEHASHEMISGVHEIAGREEAKLPEVERVELAQAQSSQTTDQTPAGEQSPKTDRVEAAPPAPQAAANPNEVVPDQNNVAHLAANVSLDDIRIEGANLVLVQPDGTEIVIINGAAHVPTFLIGEVELPRDTVIAALNDSHINVAAGPDGGDSASAAAPSSGAEFQDTTPGGDDAPTELAALLADTQQLDGGPAGGEELRINHAPTIELMESGLYIDTENDDEFKPIEGFVPGHDLDRNDALRYGVEGGQPLAGDPKYDIVKVGTYGELRLNSATGAYVFTPNDAAIEGLKDHQAESFTFTITDKAGASGTQVWTVEVNGVNDTASISGNATGSVVEDGKPGSQGSEGSEGNMALRVEANDGKISAEGQLTVSDRDTGDDHFQTPASEALAGKYGNFSFDPATGKWSYVLNNDTAAVQGLRAGDAVHETLTVTSADGTATQVIDVTVFGTNDAPVIAGGTNPAALAELADASHQDIGGVTGTLTVTDADVGDNLTGSVTGEATAQLNGGALPEGVDVKALIASGAISFNSVTTDGGSKTLTWTYDPKEANLDWLSAGETLTITYNAQVNDGHGNVGTQPITVTITGTNDAPVVAAGVSASITEQAGQTFSTAYDTAHLTIGFTDADLSNTGHTAQVTGVTASGVTNGLLTSNFGNAVLENLLKIDSVSKASGSDQGSVSATFQARDLAFDYLGVGEKLTLTYTIQVNDGAGGVTNQTVDVVITGTNDAPVLSTGLFGLGSFGFVDEANNTTGSTKLDTTKGTLYFADADLSDTHHDASVTGVVASGDTAGLDLTKLTGFMQTSVQNGANIGTLDWKFAAADKTFDYLGARDQLKLTYTIQISDGHGGTDTQTVTIIVDGSNDKPVITGFSNPVAIVEAVDASHQNIGGVTGTLTVSDADIGDTLTGSVKGAATAVFNGGTIPNNVDVSALIAKSAISFNSVTTDGGAKTLTWTYDPAAANLDWLPAGKTLTITYNAQVNDGYGNVGTQPITITITGTNDKPVIDGTHATGSVVEDGFNANGGHVGQSTISDTLVKSDADADDNATNDHWAILVSKQGGTSEVLNTNGKYGTFSVDQNGKWTYALDDDRQATQELNLNQKVTETFTVQVTDSHGATATQQVVVTITGSNDKPVISGGDTRATVIEAGIGANGQYTAGDASESGTLKKYDVDDEDDASNDTWSVAVPGHPTPGDVTSVSGVYGSFSVNQDGKWTYNLNNSLTATQALGRGQTAQEVFYVQVKDTHGATATEVVRITVVGTNDAPVGAADAYTVSEDGKLTVEKSSGVLANDTDVENNALTAVLVSGPAHGTLTFKPDGSFVYTPTTNYHGDDSFTYKPNDGMTNGEPVVVKITVGSVEDHVFTDGSETRDLTKFSADQTMTSPNNPYFEDGNYLNAKDGDDTVYLPNASNGLGQKYADLYAAGGTFNGGAGNDKIYGGDLDDRIAGGAGNDLIDGGSNSAVGFTRPDAPVSGGATAILASAHGGDTADYSAVATGIIANLGDSAANWPVTIGAHAASGDGNDTLTNIENVTGGAGDDVIFGDNNANILIGGAGSDTLIGGGGNDLLYGGDDNVADGLYAGAGDDVLILGNGGGTAKGEAGNDLIYGGTGNDYLYGDDDGPHDASTDGNDIIFAGAGNDYIQGNGGDDKLYGEDGDDTIVGGAGDDIIDGGAGNDTILYALGDGADVIDGGTGSDTLKFTTPDGGPTLIEYIKAVDNKLLIAATDSTDANLPQEKVLTATNVETLDIDVKGYNWLVFGHEGSDLKSAGVDTVKITGDDNGNSVFFAEVSSATALQANLNGGDDLFVSGGQAATQQVDGGSGVDTFDFRQISEQLNIDLESGVATRSSLNGQNLIATDKITNFENVDGSIGNDTIRGTSGANVIDGGSGNDVIEGRGGADQLYGGDGNDRITAGSELIANGGFNGPVQVMVGSDGPVDLGLGWKVESGSVDLLFTNGEILNAKFPAGVNAVDMQGVSAGKIDQTFATVAGQTYTISFLQATNPDLLKTNSGTTSEVTVNVHNANGTLDASQPFVDYAKDGIDWTTVGGTFVERTITFTATSNSTTIEFAAGGNTPYGSLIAEVSVTQSGSPAAGATLDGGAGNDIITGGSGDDTIFGGTGDDLIRGGEGNDTIDGGDGDDFISGGKGNDTLRGGAGNDIFSLGADIADATGYGDRTIDLGNGHSETYSISGLAGTGDAVDGGSGYDTIVLDAGGANGFVLDASYNGTPNFAHVEAISGTGGNDIILMNANYTSDVQGGGITIDGGAGNDIIQGGAGNDTLIGGIGNDLISGLGGDDTISGGAGDDRLYGGAGNDTISGGDGNDFISGGTGNDTLSGGAGNDTFSYSTGDGTDKVDGGDGNDTLHIAGSDTGSTFNINAVSIGGVNNLAVNIEAGSTANAATAGNYEVATTNVEEWVIDGGKGNDTFVVSGDLSGTGLATSTITINGGAGNDLIVLDRGANNANRVVVDGGNNSDVGDSVKLDFKYTEITHVVATVHGFEITHNGVTDVFTNIENFQFSDGVTQTYAELVAPPEAPVLTVIDDQLPKVGDVANAGATNDQTPTIHIALANTGALAGDSVQLYDKGLPVGAAHVLTAAEISQGYAEITTGTLPEGSHSFTAAISDLFNHTGATSDAFAITVDITPPAVSIVTIEGGNDVINASEALNGIAISGQAEIGSTLKVNGADVTVGADGHWTTSIVPTVQGALTVTAIATDAAGNSSTATHNLTIDTIAPAVSIVTIEGGNDVINASEAANGIQVSGNAEAGSTLTVNGAAVVVDSNGHWTTSITPTGQGPLTVTAIATDAAGNSSTATHQLSVDTVAPTATIVFADNNLTIGETSKVTITFSEAVTGFTNDDLTVENGLLSNVTSNDNGKTWTATFTPTVNMSDAVNVITLAAGGVTDAAGNTNAQTQSDNYVVNTVPPNTAPVGGDDHVITNMSSVAIPDWALLLNDKDADGDSLTITSAGNPYEGSVTHSPENATTTFVDGGRYYGGSFEYVVTDGTTPGSATVSVETNLSNWLVGTNSGDIIIGGSDYTTIYAGGGNDVLIGGGGNDYLRGGTGDDVYAFGLNDGNDLIVEEGGTDRILIAANGQALASLVAYDSSTAQGKGDLVIALGNNSITVQDHFEGGDDKVESISFDGATVNGYNLGTGSYAISSQDPSSAGGYRTIDLSSSTVNNLIAGESGAADAITGGKGSDLIFGAGGDDRLDGGKGDDYLVGDAGNDIVNGGDGNDTIVYTIGDGVDTIDGGAGNDRLVILGTGASENLSVVVTNNTITTLAGGSVAGIETVTLALDGGIDTLSYGTTSQGVVVDLSAGTATGFASITGVDNIVGGAGNDVLTGDANANSISGGGGDDIIVGAQNDTLLDGGIGNDTLQVGSNFTASSDGQIANIETVTMTSASTLNLSNQSEGFTINGSSGNDTIAGGSGKDTILGGDGNDTVTGGKGADILTGGAGSDIFKFAAGDSTISLGGSKMAGTISGYDVVTDFKPGSTQGLSDRIAYTNASVSTSVGGNDSDLQLHTGYKVSSGSVSGGVATFVDAHGSTVSLTSITDVAAVVDFLQGNNIGGTGSTVAFNATIDGIAHTFLFTQGSTTGSSDSNDVLVDLKYVTATGITASNGQLTVAGSSAIDPIILDLDHNGVALTSLDHGVQFDINADGHKDQIAWTAGSDGILALDVDGNGKIDNGSEIFSPHFAGGNYATGLAALATLDTNHDGKIDAADEAFSKLTIWQDLNHNGLTDAGELSSLADQHITSISLDAAASNTSINGQTILSEGSYSTADGGHGSFVEVAFDTTLGGSEDGAHAYSLIGSSGDDVLSGAGGMYTLTGGAGADTFVLDADALKDVKLADVITDYKAGEGDTLDVSKLLDSLLGHQATEAEALASVKTTVSGSDTVVSVNANGGWHDVAVLQNATEAVKILFDDKHDTTTAPHVG